MRLPIRSLDFRKRLRKTHHVHCLLLSKRYAKATVGS